MSVTEPALLSLTEVAQAIAQKRVSSREVTQSCLDRIAQWQPRLNAFMSIEADEALAAADATDKALSAGATKVTAPAKKPWGQTVGYVRDNNGFLVELCTAITE